MGACRAPANPGHGTIWAAPHAGAPFDFRPVRRNVALPSGGESNRALYRSARSNGSRLREDVVAMAEVERRPEKKMAEKRAANTGKIMSLDSELNPRRINRSSGLAEEVYKMIRADIMSLRIPPGTRILVDNLAREL